MNFDFNTEIHASIQNASDPNSFGILVIHGPSRTGKSTLAKYLSDQLSNRLIVKDGYEGSLADLYRRCELSIMSAVICVNREITMDDVKTSCGEKACNHFWFVRTKLKKYLA